MEAERQLEVEVPDITHKIAIELVHHLDFPAQIDNPSVAHPRDICGNQHVGSARIYRLCQVVVSNLVANYAP
jgi:hypothetical protein